MKILKSFFLVAAMAVGACRSRFATANGETTIGRHSTATTKRADAAHASRHLLVKLGSDSDHVAVTGAGDRPFGVTDDCPAAAEDPINVHFLSGHGTKRMIATGALAIDTDVYTAAGGKVSGLSATPGTYYHVGRTMAAAAQSDDSLYYVEVETKFPTPVTVS